MELGSLDEVCEQLRREIEAELEYMNPAPFKCKYVGPGTDPQAGLTGFPDSLSVLGHPSTADFEGRSPSPAITESANLSTQPC
jgi:hypothetical protein